MNTFIKIVFVLLLSLSVFVFILSMDNIGMRIGFEEMKYVGIALLFGITTMKILMVEEDNKNKSKK